MPGRKAKPPRLWFREDEGTWVILDRGRQIRTGLGREQIEGASQALEVYLGSRHTPTIGGSNPAELPLADIVTFYEERKRPKTFLDLKRKISERESVTPDQRKIVRRHDELLIRLDSVNRFFGAKKLSDVKGDLCRDYVDWCTGTPNDRIKDLEKRRVISDQTARRHLDDLRSAINAYHAEHTLNFVPKVTLPEKRQGRERWLTRSEAARLLGASLGFVWDKQANQWKRKEEGGLFRSDRRVRTVRKPTARFILIGLYSARREETIRRTQWIVTTTHPWMDIERWTYHGRGREERRTKKRRPAAKVANRLRPHLARWHRLDTELSQKLGTAVRFLIHRSDGSQYNEKIRTAWDGILEDAGLGPEVVRHVLRHTAATWLMQRGTDRWQAAGWLAMTLEQLEEGYGHHHPDFQEDAAQAFGGR